MNSNNNAERASTSSRILLSAAAVALCGLIMAGISTMAVAGAGDEWTVVRGDASPGVFYNTLVETATGRLIAAGNGGQLMISDDGGDSWRYEVILVGEQPLFGRVSAMIAKGSELIGTVNFLIPSENDYDLPFEGLTQIITSIDDGETWTLRSFPVDSALFGGQPSPGIYLDGLHVSPAGELLAYGSTVLASRSVAYFIGGLVFRRVGSSWEQAFFELGKLESMSDANGRLVAAGFQTVVDSPDGAGWEGYLFRDGNLLVDGDPLADKVERRLLATDIAYENGTYVMQAQALIPRKGSRRILTTAVDRTFTFRGANPFDGGRTWVGTEHNRLYSFYLSIGGRLLSMIRAVYSTDDGGQTWDLIEDGLDMVTRSFAPVGSNGAVAVRSSDEAWRSSDGGSTWEKVFEQPPSVDLVVDLRVGGVLFARADGRTLWRSLDNGLTWSQIADVFAQTGRGFGRLREVDGILFAPQGAANQIASSSDGGLTWQAITTPASSSQGLADIVVGRNGRLIIAPQSKSSETVFYYSDDLGSSWQASQPVSLQFSASVGRGVSLGDGRIVYLFNQFASFEPALFISDDNGQSWRRENPFEGLAGLSVDTSGQTVIDLGQILRSTTGRLVIFGGRGELLTSDDRGDSWVVQASLEDEEDLDWELFDIEQVRDRLIIPGRRKKSVDNSSKVFFALISEDDGNSWREVIVPTNLSGSSLQHVLAAVDGRVIFSGSNGAVYVSESDALPTAEPVELQVREGETLIIDVPRPPADGAVSADYYATSVDAAEDADFVALSGSLEWAADDFSVRQISLQTLDDAFVESVERLTVDVRIEAGLLLDSTYSVAIIDNDGTGEPGIETLGDMPLQTAEDGRSTSFRLALTDAPTTDVTLDLSVGFSGEIALDASSLTFTPGNWNTPQSVTVTGLDDADRDHNVAVKISVSATSADPGYDGLRAGSVYVTNLDDERDEVVFQSGFEP